MQKETSTKIEAFAAAKHFRTADNCATCKNDKCMMRKSGSICDLWEGSKK